MEWDRIEQLLVSREVGQAWYVYTMLHSVLRSMYRMISYPTLPYPLPFHAHSFPSSSVLPDA